MYEGGCSGSGVYMRVVCVYEGGVCMRVACGGGVVCVYGWFVYEGGMFESVVCVGGWCVTGCYSW